MATNSNPIIDLECLTCIVWVLYIFINTEGKCNGAASLIEESRTSRDMTTPTSRPVSMISRNYNINPVIHVRSRW